MSTPVASSRPVRLDDLIAAVEKSHDDVLSRLSSAVIAADHLGEVADSLIGYFVDQARGAGASWTEIGGSMGVTKQAAQKRFVRRAAPSGAPGPDPDQGFGHFTQRARNVVMVAQNEAQAAHHDLIGPEHLMLGLVSDPESLGARAVVAQGVALEAARQAVVDILPPAAGPSPDLVPFDARAKDVLQRTFLQAQRLGHDRVGTGHILLALLELEGVAGVLADVDPAVAAAFIVEQVAEQTAAQG